MTEMNRTSGVICRRQLGWVLAASPLLLLSLLAGSTLAAPKWKWELREDNVNVFTREVPGRGFPTFKGVGDVNASIFEVLAVLSDIERHPDWIGRCIEARRLKKLSEREYIVYSRTDAPFPVADRDAVFHSRATVDLEKKQVTVSFKAVKSELKPEVDGVVRLTRLEGHYRFTALDEGWTRVEYQVDADPQGSLPTWLAKMATRKLPVATITNLRKQLEKSKGWYKDRIRRWKEGKY